MSGDRWLRETPAPSANTRALSEWLSIFALLFLVVALGLTVFTLLHDRAASGVPREIQRHMRYGSLRLRADKSGELWKVSWDPQSGSLKHAQTAELFIDDGPYRTSRSLFTAQLSLGYTTYSPRTNDVVFQLQTFDKDDNQTSATLRLFGCGRDTKPSGVETSEAVWRPAKVRPVAKNYPSKTQQANFSTGSPLGSSRDASALSEHFARPVILNNGVEPAAARRMQSNSNPSEAPDLSLDSRPPASEPPKSVAVAPDSSDSSSRHTVKLRRVFEIFPKTGRKIRHFFWISLHDPDFADH